MTKERFFLFLRPLLSPCVIYKEKEEDSESETAHHVLSISFRPTFAEKNHWDRGKELQIAITNLKADIWLLPTVKRRLFLKVAPTPSPSEKADTR